MTELGRVQVPVEKEGVEDPLFHNPCNHLISQIRGDGKINPDGDGGFTQDQQARNDAAGAHSHTANAVCADSPDTGQKGREACACCHRGESCHGEAGGG